MKYDREAMADWFRRQAKEPQDWRIGLETERFAVFPDSGAPLPYAGGRQSVRAILAWLEERYGLQGEREGGHLLALVASQGQITIEPGSQVEIALRPQPDLDILTEQLATFHGQLAECAEALGFAWLALGVHPYALAADRAMIPKRRYVLMKEYFDHCGPLAHEMMRSTCSVQISLDFRDEDHFRRLMRLVHALAPLCIAWFGNSWFSRAVPGDELNKRSRIWTRTDPDRCGPVPGAIEGELDFAAYAAWLEQVPMIFVRDRDGKTLRAARGLPFRDFADGLGREAAEEDFLLQQTAVFPLARLRSYLEIRCCDGLPAQYLVPVASFWTGLCYSGRALAAAEERIAGLGQHELERGIEDAIRFGLGAGYGGRTLREWALDLVEVAASGLETPIGRSFGDPTRGRERLGRLRALAERDESLSGELRRRFGLRRPDPAALLFLRGMPPEITW